MEGLKDKTAVITGGATGIGKALALALAAESMRIVIASTNEARLRAAAQEIGRTTGATIRWVVCDVADREAVRRLAAEVEAEFGGTDLLCANAGVTTSGPFLDHRDADWDWVMDVVLKGVTNCIQAFYPTMAARGSGHIVVTGSQTGYAPDWVLGHGPYVAAKAAVHALALALRPEAAGHGVGVTLLVPAGTHTDMLTDGERSRPADLGAPLGGGMTIRADAPQGAPGYPFLLSPEEVAARAVAGIKADLPIVVTHASMRPLAEEYCARILSAYDAAARFEG